MRIRTRIGAVIIKEGKLLMQIGKGYKELWLPGGKIDEGENDEVCLRRELKEEINVDLTKATFFKEYTTVSFYNSEIQIIERIYIAEIEGEVKPDSEIEQVIWLTKEDVVNKVYPMIPHNEEELIPDLIEAGVWE